MDNVSFDDFVKMMPEVLRKMGSGSGVLLHDEDGLAKATWLKPGAAQKLVQPEFFFVPVAMDDHAELFGCEQSGARR